MPIGLRKLRFGWDTHMNVSITWSSIRSWDGEKFYEASTSVLKE